jgi:class IV lanthipeptide synthase
MATDQEIQDLARDGADSVFAYVERTAEPVPDGFRWQTKSYQNQMQHHPSVYDGVAGISAFLSDYHRLRGSARARELAEGALLWCSAPEQAIEAKSLMAGRAGLGMSWLRLAQATGERAALSRASEAGQALLDRPPGPITDAVAGAAGEGIFLLRLWKESHEERFLAGAARNAEWLEAQAIRDESGCQWVFNVGDKPSWRSLGFGHGVAGIGYFLLLAYEATGDRRHEETVLQAIRTLAGNALPDRGGLNWPVLPGEKELKRCQWCHGAPGVGLFFVKAAEALKDPAHLETAKAAGEATFAYGDVRKNPSQCHGLAGNAELFLELYQATRDRLWLERAHEFAKAALAYRTRGPEGDSWQSDVRGMDSPDFMCGAAGVGHFFLRLGAPGRLRMPFA